MKCLRFWRVVALLAVLASAVSMPQNSSTRSNPQPMGETIKQLTDQLMEINSTSQMTYDTRTPPRVKQQFKKLHAQKMENSHPGIAEPVDEDALLEEESIKKLNFYKTDTKPTTDSGLSTWILLSGQGSLTTKPTKKSVTTKNANISNTFVVEDLNKVIKPIFKRKLPSTTTTSTTTTTTTTTKRPVTTASATLNFTTVVTEKTTKLTKVKASLLNNALNKNSTTKKATTPKMAVITVVTTTTAKPTKQAKLTTIEPSKKKTTEYVKVTTKTTKAALNNSIESNSVLEPEAKEGALDLTQTTPQSKKIKRPVVVATTTAPLKKKTKTKNRRKRPSADDKADGNTKVTKNNKNKEKPFGAQIYNYLSREVMPTVGVGLVGLMVTAGLASYFLYPFGPARRSYEIDRKDKVGSYYYNDEYSGGIAEEDAIGKVIAGMPSNANLNNYNIRAQNSRNRFQNRYRSDQSYMQGSVETVHLNPQTNYKTADLIIGSPKNHHNNYDNYEVTNEDVYTKNEPEETKKFVVGNVPKEVQDENVTPMVVPEHGPRNMDKENVFVVNSVPGETSESTEKFDHGPRLFRSRRQTVEENEIDSDNLIKQTLTTSITNVETSSTSSPETSTSPSSSEASTGTLIPETADTTYKPPYEEKSESFVELIRDLFYYKLRLGLQLLQSKTESLSRYFKRVQERIDSTYREGERL